jgi:AraC-like DNA-binding protein
MNHHAIKGSPHEYEIARLYARENRSISALAREYGVSRPTLQKYFNSDRYLEVLSELKVAANAALVRATGKPVPRKVASKNRKLPPMTSLRKFDPAEVDTTQLDTPVSELLKSVSKHDIRDEAYKTRAELTQLFFRSLDDPQYLAVLAKLLSEYYSLEFKMDVELGSKQGDGIMTDEQQRLREAFEGMFE